VGLIPLGPASPRASCDATRKLGRATLERFPISSCTEWGLPCDRRYRRPGELLPHPFTLTERLPFGCSSADSSLWHCPRGHPHQALPGTLPCGARTFLSRTRPRSSPRANPRTASTRTPIVAGRVFGNEGVASAFEKSAADPADSIEKSAADPADSIEKSFAEVFVRCSWSRS